MIEIRLVRRNGDEFIEIVTNHTHLRLRKGKADETLTFFWDQFTRMEIEEVIRPETEEVTGIEKPEREEGEPEHEQEPEIEEPEPKPKFAAIDRLTPVGLKNAGMCLVCLLKANLTAKEIEMLTDIRGAHNYLYSLIDDKVVSRYKSDNFYIYHIITEERAKKALEYIKEKLKEYPDMLYKLEAFESEVYEKPAGIKALFSDDTPKGKLEDIFGDKAKGKKSLIDVIKPTTSPKSLLFVNKDDSGNVVLQWETSGRVTDEVVILDTNKLYTFLRSKAVDNKLFYSDLNRILKQIHGFSTNKISAIFNYVGLSREFKTKMVKDKLRYGRQIHYEWCIEFLKDSDYDDEYWKGYWRNKMVEERKLLEGILR